MSYVHILLITNNEQLITFKFRHLELTTNNWQLITKITTFAL